MATVEIQMNQFDYRQIWSQFVHRDVKDFLSGYSPEASIAEICQDFIASGAYANKTFIDAKLSSTEKEYLYNSMIKVITETSLEIVCQNCKEKEISFAQRLLLRQLKGIIKQVSDEYYKGDGPTPFSDLLDEYILSNADLDDLVEYSDTMSTIADEGHED